MLSGPSQAREPRSWEKEACRKANKERYTCTEEGKIQCLEGWIGDLCQVTSSIITCHKPHTVSRSRCVVMTVTPSMATAWSLGSVSVTWDIRAPAAGTVSSCPAASTGTAPRASPVTVSLGGAGCSVMCRSVTRSAGREGSVWPRGCVSVSLVTRVRTAVSVPRPPGVCTEPAVSLCSVTVSQAGQGSCVTLQCAQTRAARSTAHAQSQARVGVN